MARERAEQPREEWKPFAERLKRAVEETGEPAMVIATRAGTNSGNLSKLTRAFRGPPTGTLLMRLAEVLNVRAEWLVEGKEPMRPGAVVLTPGPPPTPFVPLGEEDPLDVAVRLKRWVLQGMTPRQIDVAVEEAKSERAMLANPFAVTVEAWETQLTASAKRVMGKMDKSVASRPVGDDADSARSVKPRRR